MTLADGTTQIAVYNQHCDTVHLEGVIVRVNSSGLVSDFDLGVVGAMDSGQVMVLCGPLVSFGVGAPPCDVSIGPVAWGASAEDTVQLFAGIVSLDTVAPADAAAAASLQDEYALYRGACDGCLLAPQPTNAAYATATWVPMPVTGASLKCRPPTPASVECEFPYPEMPACGDGGS